MLLRSRLVMLASLILAAPLVAQGPPPRVAYASDCGSEIAWLGDFDEALAQAKAQQKPVLWFPPVAYRSRMDRKQELYWYSMGGVFSDPVVASWIRETFVPLRLSLGRILRRGLEEVSVAGREPAKALAERYGVEHLSFIEPGFLLLTADGELVQTVDRINTYNREHFINRIERILAAHPKALPIAAPQRPVPADHDAIRSALAKGDASAALIAFEGLSATSPEARFLAGVALHMLNRDLEGLEAWRKLATAHPDSAWGRKARLEVDGWGPFRHGFESYRAFPAFAAASDELRTSRVAANPDEAADDVARLALLVLLDLQRHDGSFNDSRYDFGGLDSLPNVHVAVSAIAGRSLLAWRKLMPERIDRALDALLPYLLDENNTNPDDDDELVWAHTYRLWFFAELCKERPKEKSRISRKMGEIVALLEKLQHRSGAWRHEYANPFVTASTIQALHFAKEAGIRVSAGRLKTGAKSLSDSRGDNGAFAYATGRSAGNVAPEASAGRSPLCELALLLEGQSTPERLEQAIETSFKHHELLEAVRRYDDHSDRYGNGGFFFWYDLEGRAAAIEASPSPKKSAWQQQLRDIVFQIRQADGGFLDSHELGKSYGTAMGLHVLEAVTGPRP